MERNKIDLSSYDSTIPYILQGAVDNMAEHQKICPAFGTSDGYNPHNRECMRCALAMVCLTLQDFLHTGNRIEEVKKELGTRFYDESTFHIHGRAIVNDVVEAIVEKLAEGRKVSVQSVRTTLNNLIQTECNNDDPTAVDVAEFAVSRSPFVTVKGDYYVRR